MSNVDERSVTLGHVGSKTVTVTTYKRKKDCTKSGNIDSNREMTGEGNLNKQKSNKNNFRFRLAIRTDACKGRFYLVIDSRKLGSIRILKFSLDVQKLSSFIYKAEIKCQPPEI